VQYKKAIMRKTGRNGSYAGTLRHFNGDFYALQAACPFQGPAVTCQAFSGHALSGSRQPCDSGCQANVSIPLN
jgi:hypothetical protein